MPTGLEAFIAMTASYRKSTKMLSPKQIMPPFRQRFFARVRGVLALFFPTANIDGKQRFQF
jgi:hypothetical protein